MIDFNTEEELTEEKIAELTKLYQKTLDFLKRIEKEYPTWDSNIPSACKNCSNHPSNGGSGICHCTLGLQEMRW